VGKRHPDGYDTAILAMELLAQAHGRGEDRWKKIVDLRQRRLDQTQRSWGPGRAEEVREAKEHLLRALQRLSQLMLYRPASGRR